MRNILFFLLLATAAHAQLDATCANGKFCVKGDSITQEKVYYQWTLTRTPWESASGTNYQITSLHTETSSLTLDSCGTYLYARRNVRFKQGNGLMKTEAVEWHKENFEPLTLDVVVSPNPAVGGQTLKISVSGNNFKRFRVTAKRYAPSPTGFASWGWKYQPATLTYPVSQMSKGDWVVTVFFETECGEKIQVTRKLLIQ